MASKSDLARIRRAASGASRKLKDFTRALDAVRNIKIRETQKAGREVSRQLFTRFAAQLYANENGDVQRLGRFGKAWGERKKALGLRRERGQARRGIYKQIRSPMIYAKLADGFDIDIKRPALWVTGTARLTKRAALVLRNKAGGKVSAHRYRTTQGSFYVNSYIDHYANQKARGLGLLANEDLEEIERRANEKISDHLHRIRGAARAALATRAHAKFMLSFRRAA